jgi:gliding motility-associated-like protein
MRYGIITILIFFSLPVFAQFQGLVINEFSQGDQGSKEYIELLVAGKRTCSDSTADIRGWVVDDQNGWYGTTSLTTGHYRFKDVSNWTAVPIGSIILLYNSAANGINNSILLPDDPTDANKDLIYVVPINSNAFLEENDNEPSGVTGPTYVYPPPGSTTGYNGTSNTWLFHIGLSNGSDVICTVSPQNRNTHYFSIGYGYPILPGFRGTSVAVAAVNAGNNCYLTDSSYTTIASWAITAVPVNETPGFPNGGINTNWIQGMRITPGPVATYTTACSSVPYSFYNQTFTSTGLYTVLNNNINRCVDTAKLYLVIRQEVVTDTSYCDSLIYKGITYKNDTTITENISSLVLNCDSLIRTVNINIKKSSSSLTGACVGIGQTYFFNGLTLSASGTYTVTIPNAKGCDSIAKLTLLVTSLQASTISGCGTVVFEGVTYTSSTIIYDTVKSLALNCDSIIRQTTIQINPVKATSLTACANDGDSYLFHNQALTTSGTYTTVLSTQLGCDSILTLQLVFKKTRIQNISGCDSVVRGGVVYYATATLKDTLRSIISNCDSIITITYIVILRRPLSNITACITQGQAYNFNGQSLTVTGNYSTVYQQPAGCDSTVNLYLVVGKNQVQNIAGCDSVLYRGVIYTSSTLISDTVRSSITSCDSIINSVAIQVNKKPSIQISSNATICRGDSIRIGASSSTGSVNWIGFGQRDSITVNPVFTTFYPAVATDGNNCTNSTGVTVFVQEFNLEVSASPPLVLSGKPVFLQTVSTFPYRITSWQPVQFFRNQTGKTQELFADSSLQIRVTGTSPLGCKDTAFTSIEIIPLDDVYIPSAFTPNRDGKNEIVRVYGTGIKELDFKIFNRWGQMVFHTSDKNKAWDGTVTGTIQPAGTYVYVVRVKKSSSLVVEKKGTITLIR